MSSQAGAGREPVSFLVFAASLRSGSLNGRLAELAARTIEENGGTVELASMTQFVADAYDQDLENEGAFPEGAARLRSALLDCDGFVIASPEYNASIPGVLKNSIDWVSRYRPQPLNELDGMLISASPSMVGGNRGLWALRVPFEHLGARIHPDMFSLAQAHHAFAADGTIEDEALAQRFESVLVSFMDSVEAHKHYPCAKKTWFEYLGERPEAATERVE